MGYCTHESRLVLRSAEIQPFIPRFVRFSCAIDLCRLIVQICTPTNTNTHTHHQLYTYRLDTHTYRVARNLLPGVLAPHTPTTQYKRPGVVSPATVPASTHVCVCLCTCCTGKRRPGLFLCVFQSRATGCNTHPVSLTTCAFHVENSFSDPILEPGVLHISTLTSMSRRCQMCPPLSAVHLLACRFVVLHARDRHRGGRSRNK